MQIAFLGNLVGFEIYILLFIFVIPLFLWIIAIIDLVQRKFEDSTNKIVWALVILMIPALGSILYLIIGRKGGVK
jgi:Phospholipase_D-nuclease N-terminal